MCKSQRAKIFRGFVPNSIGTLQSKPPNPPAPKLRNSQFGSNGPNWKFLAHTLIAKTASKKIGALIDSMKFLSPEVALYVYKSSIHPCMEYLCQVWAGASICYLELLEKL